MKIKIEIDSGMISPREYAVRTIAKEIVKTGIKEKQIWYNEAAIQTELKNAEVGRLVRCWLKKCLAASTATFFAISIITSVLKEPAFLATLLTFSQFVSDRMFSRNLSPSGHRPGELFGFRDLLFVWRLVIRRGMALDDDLRFVRVPAFLRVGLGNLFSQADRQAVFIQRTGVAIIVHNVDARRLWDCLVVAAILIVQIRYPVPVANIPVLLLGGFHCVSGLFFRQTIEQHPGAIPESGDQTPRGEKLNFIHENTPFRAVSVNELGF